MQTDTTPAAAAVLAKVSDDLRDVVAAVLDSAEGWNAYNPRIEAVETAARSGFVPFTDGGWDGRITAGVYGSQGGGYLPKCLDAFASDDYAAKVAAYVAETYPAETFADGEAAARFERDVQSYDTAPDAYHKAEAFENGWQEQDSEFYYDARALLFGPENTRNETGEAEVYLFAGVNVDFEYGRDSVPWLACYGSNPNMHRGEWSRTVKVSDLTPEVLAECQAAMIDALAKA